MPQPNPTSAITLDDVRAVSPALAKYTEAMVVTDLWARPDLSTRERSIVTVSALIMRNQTISMPHYVNKALDCGVTPGEVSEIITHVAFYAGWPNALAAVAIVKDIFAQRGLTADQLAPVSPERLPREQALPNDAPRVAFVNDLRPICPGLMDYTDDVLFEEVWRRPGLALPDRNLATLGALIAGGQSVSLAYYLNRALAMGITKAQVSETLTQVAFYAGWPIVLSVMSVVKTAFTAQPG